MFVGTQADNVADKTAKGRQVRGERHHKAQLTDDAVRDMRAAYAGGVTRKELQRIFRTSKSVVQKIVTYDGWRHLSHPPSTLAR